MSSGNPNPKKLVEFAETDAIRKLLGGVARRGGKTPPPEPAATPADAIAPAMAFVGNDAEVEHQPELPPPLPPIIELPPAVNAPPVVEAQPPFEPVTKPRREPEPESPPPVPRPIGALTFGELLQRMNWRNRPDAIEPLTLIGVPQPAGFADTVEGVLSVFNWDDE